VKFSRQRAAQDRDEPEIGRIHANEMIFVKALELIVPDTAAAISPTNQVQPNLCRALWGPRPKAQHTRDAYAPFEPGDLPAL